MSEQRFARSALVAAPATQVAQFFAAAETWFRLNPEWEVLACDAEVLKVRYERSEEECEYRRPAGADFSGTGATVVLAGELARTLHIAWAPVDADRTRIEITEEFATSLETARLAELNLWFDATVGYLAIAARKDRRGRFMCWLLDRFWLKMSPTARRVGLLVIGMEALALLLFVAILVVYRLSG